LGRKRLFKHGLPLAQRSVQLRYNYLKMKTIQFSKYQGAGNDFVMIDDRSQTFPAHDTQLVAQLCDRHFGIGADGLILIQLDAQADFRMVYFNANGAEGSMCGNGGRCAVRFAHALEMIADTTTFVAADGPHQAQVKPQEISLKMGKVSQITQHPKYDFLNTGSPHVVQYVESPLSNLDVVQEGRKVRYAEEWVQRGGTNVNFVEVSNNELFVRTYERGVENETLACGTGATACALSAHVRWGIPSPIKVKVMGGTLSIHFNQDTTGEFDDIWLVGPAEHVFGGVISV
jgi:diaminopimelate epimerase